MHSGNAISLVIALAVGIAIGITICSVRTKEPAQPTPEPVVEETAHDTSMHGTMDAMTSGLEGKSGDAFDKAFIDEMIAHHQGAIDMANQVRLKSQRPELQQLALDIIEAQTGEIKMMREWRTTWFGE